MTAIRPDTPLPISMMTRAEASDLASSFLVPVVNPNAPIGQKNLAATLQAIATLISYGLLNPIVLEGANAIATLSNGSLNIEGSSGESILSQAGLQVKKDGEANPSVVDLTRYLLALYASSVGGYNRTEVSANGVSIKYASSGEPVEYVRLDYNGIKTPRLQLTFDNGGQPSAVEDVQSNRSMTDTESFSEGSTPTEYFVAIQPGTSGFAGYDYYILNSTAHPVGTIVMLRNVGESDLKIYRSTDTERDYVLCEIPAKGTKCFIYHGMEASGSVWDMV